MLNELNNGDNFGIQRDKINDHIDVTNYISPIVDSLSIDRQSITVVVESTHVYLDVEKIDGGDISYIIDGVERVLDCTTGDGINGKARVELIQGTTDDPRKNVAYVIHDDQLDKLVLLASNMLPNGATVGVAIVAIRDYVTVTTDKCDVIQRVTESIAHNGRGNNSYIRMKLRSLGALYLDGIDQTFEIIQKDSLKDDLFLYVLSGLIFQLHIQDFPPLNVKDDGISIVNASGNGTLSNYQKINNLNEILEISDGTTINDGDCYNLMVWASINYSVDTCRLYVTLPNEKYTNETDARRDLDNITRSYIPRQFSTVGFMVCRICLKYSSTNGGTWSNILTKEIETWQSEYRNISSPNYPSNYSNNSNTFNTFQKVGATKVRLRFDAFNTEANYDFVSVRNATDPFPTSVSDRRTDPLSYDGNMGSFTSDIITGDTIRTNFTSDGSVTRQGYHISALEYATVAQIGNEIVDLRGIQTGFNL